MSCTRLNPPITELLKVVTYNETRSNYSGSQTFTHTAPTGYKLFIEKPLASYTSGDVNAFVSDRSLSLSGTTLTASLYIRNPNGGNVTVSYTVIYISN